VSKLPGKRHKRSPQSFLKDVGAAGEAPRANGELKTASEAPCAQGVSSSVELDRLLRVKDVLQLVPVSRSTLHRMVRRGAFPRPIRISTNAVGFSRRDVAAFIESRRDTRKAPTSYRE
jgi:prophage regulatory protein